VAPVRKEKTLVDKHRTGAGPGEPSLTRRTFVQATVAGLVAAAEEQRPAPAFLAGSDWPMYRHDPALSAVCPLRGGLAEAPRVAWSLDLGGPHVPSESVVVRDVTGDGRDEFLTLTTDSITCRDSRGRLLWKLDNFPNPTLLDTLDFAGDGSRGILLTTTRAGKVDTYLVSGRTGKAAHLWLDENNFGGHTRVGKLLPGVAGLQIAATASGQTPPAPHGGDVRLVSFEHGLDRPHFRVRQHVTGVFYSPLLLVADLDGDGREEVVVISHEQVWAFDPDNGRQTFYAAYAPSIRTYLATVAVVKLGPADACPALVMINPSLPGLKAVCQDGKTFARELWRVVVGGKEDQYQKRVKLAPAGTSLVYDLDQDGHPLVLASIQNEHGDGATRLVVFDARTGRRLAELPDAQVLAADDLDGDGKQELVLKRGSELSICRWQAGDLETVWQQADVLPVLRPLPHGGDLRLTSGSSATARGNTAVWREQAGSARFLLRFPDGVHGCRLGPGGLEKGETITEHEALGNLPARQRSPERVVWDEAKLVTSIDGREVYRYVPPAPTTYLAPPPLVADLSGRRRILVRGAAGDYRLCSAEGKQERVFLERAYEIPEPVADSTGAALGPLVCDVDGDGDNEVVATVTDRKGRPVCVILDGSGKEKRRLELPPGMTTLNRGPTGRLGPGLGRWLLLRMSGEGPAHERRQLVAAYDGRTGKQLWVRNSYGRYGTNPVAFVAHFPSAVLDYDGDGADDWLVCSENFYGVLNVKENRYLVGPVVLSDALPGHWTAYTFPSVASLNGDGKPVAFHHGAYSLVLVTDLEGRPVWHFGMTRDTAGKWGQFVDVDGDGRREVLHAQPDGLIRCFTPRPSARCPTCPAGVPAAGGSGNDQRWQFDPGRPVSRLTAIDLDGDGRMEVLFGCEDGKLYALGERDGKPRLLWSVALGRRVGEPILADLDGDGRPQILVAAEDGRLYCLQGNGSRVMP
jgi:outer membrane protein assembly factor BamB